MKNILTILKELEIDVPAEKEADLNKAVSENYKTSAEHDKKVEKMQKDIDAAEERAKTAEETLKGFEGKDFETITKERDEWKMKYDTKIREDQEAKEKAELDEAIDNAIKNAKGKNAKAIRANLDMEAIKASKNRDKDIADALKNLSESEETAFLFSTDPEGNRAKPVTAPMKNNTGANDGVTKESIMQIKNSAERINAIAQHKELFQ